MSLRCIFECALLTHIDGAAPRRPLPPPRAFLSLVSRNVSSNITVSCHQGYTRDGENGDVQRVNCSSFCVEIARPPPSVPPLGFHRRGDPRAHNVQLARPSLFWRPRKRRRSFPPRVSRGPACAAFSRVALCTLHTHTLPTHRNRITRRPSRSYASSFLTHLHRRLFRVFRKNTLDADGIIGEYRIIIFYRNFNLVQIGENNKRK